MRKFLDEETRKPIWADSFLNRYHFRVTFGKLRDGREPVATVQVVSWDYDNAERKAIYTARSMFKGDNLVMDAPCRAIGYLMYRVPASW